MLILNCRIEIGYNSCGLSILISRLSLYHEHTVLDFDSYSFDRLARKLDCKFVSRDRTTTYSFFRDKIVQILTIVPAELLSWV